MPCGSPVTLVVLRCPVARTCTGGLGTSISSTVYVTSSCTESSANAGLQVRGISSNTVLIVSNVLKLLKTELILFGHLNLVNVSFCGHPGLTFNEGRICSDERVNTPELKVWDVELSSVMFVFITC